MSIRKSAHQDDDQIHENDEYKTEGQNEIDSEPKADHGHCKIEVFTEYLVILLESPRISCVKD